MSIIIRSIENNVQFIAYVHIVLLLSLILLIVVLEFFFFTFLDLNETHQNRHSHIDCGLQGLLSYTCLGEQLNYSYINLFTVYEVDIISIWLTDSATCPTQSKLVLYLLAQFS